MKSDVYTKYIDHQLLAATASEKEEDRLNVT